MKRRASIESQHNNHVGLVLGGDIDLRVFYRQWAHGFAVREMGEKEVQRSLQFFDAAGQAVHKIFLKPQSDIAAYDALVAHFADADQAAGIAVKAPAPPPAELPDAQIDVAGFRAAWADLRDTHEFFTMLKKYSVSRLQACACRATLRAQLDKSCVLTCSRTPRLKKYRSWPSSAMPA